MHVTVEFAESDGIYVEQLDELDSGYEVSSVTFDTHKVDGRLIKSITIYLTEAEQVEELVDGEDLEASDNSGTSFPPYGACGSAYDLSVSGTPGSLFNRRS